MENAFYKSRYQAMLTTFYPIQYNLRIRLIVKTVPTFLNFVLTYRLSYMICEIIMYAEEKTVEHNLYTRTSN